MKKDKGLFEVICDNCGALSLSVYDEKHIENCEFCPEHDDIARRNQESADKDYLIILGVKPT